MTDCLDMSAEQSCKIIFIIIIIFFFFLYVLLNNQDKLQYLQIITLIRRYMYTSKIGKKRKKKKVRSIQQKKETKGKQSWGCPKFNDQFTLRDYV